jgi:hypothetical protein
MTRKKRPKQKKTGKVIDFDAGQITLRITGEGTWRIKRKASTKVIGGTLKRHSRVTVEFNRGDGERIDAPGKRTEFGTVISSTLSQITLQVPAKGTWIITRTASTKVTPTNAPPGSTATVESNEEDWHQAPA